MYVDWAEALLSATVHEDVVEVARREGSERLQDVRYHAVESGRCVLQTLRYHQPLPEHPAGGTHCRERNVALSHEDLIETIHQIDRAVDNAAINGVEYHVFPRNGHICRNGGVV
jgi:hypothetical protein